jgi:hypothetical protein
MSQQQQPSNRISKLERRHRVVNFVDNLLQIDDDDDDSALSQSQTSNRRNNNTVSNQCSSLGKTTLGPLDLLVLNTSDYSNISLAHTNPSYCLEDDDHNTSTTASKLTQKLSRRSVDVSFEYPADEITEGPSSVGEHADNGNDDDDDDGNDDPNVKMVPPHDQYKNYGKEEKKESDCYDYMHVHEIDAQHDEQGNCMGSSHSIGTEQFDSKNSVAARALRNCMLNTTNTSTLPTDASEKSKSMATDDSTRQVPVVKAKRYNHYDWSYSEETSRTESRSHNRNIIGTLGIENKKSFDDTSTLATIAISNTSQIITPDTSFEFPMVMTPNIVPSKTHPSSTHGNQKSRTTASVLSPIEHDTLVIVEGSDETREFRHSSLILQYASSELARHFVECVPHENDTVLAARGSAIQFLLRVKVTDASDWCILQPFLEPHAVQPAVVCLSNLPILLPWFQQLRLNVLLQECDLQLLDHISTPPTSKQVKHHYDMSDDYVRVSNTLLLGRISVLAGLEGTARQAFTAMSKWLKHRPNVWLQRPNDNTTMLETALTLIVQCLVPDDDDRTTNIHGLDASMESCDDPTRVWESMFEPMEAVYLFAAAISYLPTDCVDRQHLNNRRNIFLLLNNPLFSYMIREGILMKQQPHQPVTSESPNTLNSHPPFDTTSTTLTEQHVSSDSLKNAANVESNAETAAEVQNSYPEMAHEQQPLSLHRTKSVDSNGTSSNTSLFQVAEDLHAGWNSLWMKIAVTAVGPSAAAGVDSGVLLSSLKKSTGRTRSGPRNEPIFPTPQKLSEWLEIIWNKLCDPPIFTSREEVAVDGKKKIPLSSGRDVSPNRPRSTATAPSKPSTKPASRRTFAC